MPTHLKKMIAYLMPRKWRRIRKTGATVIVNHRWLNLDIPPCERRVK